MKAPSLTLGIEEEYQIVDPETGELKSFITQILKDGVITVEDIKPELHQSVVEVGSTVCETPAEIREEVVRLRRAVIDLAAKDGLKILAAGTHPFSSWIDQEITPLERYQGVEQDLQDLARKNLIFGMHVHVGIEDPEFLIDAMRMSRYFLPHILALTTSSPFWIGRNTGLKSYRSVLWRNFPRTSSSYTLRRFSSVSNSALCVVWNRSIQRSTRAFTWSGRRVPSASSVTAGTRVATGSISRSPPMNKKGANRTGIAYHHLFVRVSDSRCFCVDIVNLLPCRLSPMRVSQDCVVNRSPEEEFRRYRPR